MIPIGYLAKHVETEPAWLAPAGVKAIYSVSDHISHDFADYIPFWKHNDYWLFNSLDSLCAVASEAGLSLEDCTLFYYEMFESEFDGEAWQPITLSHNFETEVVIPPMKKLEGYDVVTYSSNTRPECSPLSCNSIANTLKVNAYCLIDSFDHAKHYLDQGLFNHTEPGPYRIIAVYTLS